MSSENKTTETKPKAASRKRSDAMEVLNGVLHYRGIPVDQMRAYPICVAMAITGLRRTKLWEEIQLGRIKMTTSKLIPRAELERYFNLRGEPMP